MRYGTMMMATVAALALGGVAQAQDAPAPSYDCVLYNECGADAGTAAIDSSEAAGPQRGKTKGMSMAGNRSRVEASPAAGTASASAPTSYRRVQAATNAAPAKKPVRVAVATPTKAKKATSLSRAEQATVLSQGMTFQLGSAELTQAAQVQALALAGSMLRGDKLGTRFVIAGHTDAVGGRDYNLDLSQRRAEAVASFLTSQGVDRARLDVTGHGFDKPLGGMAPTSAANRRVEVNPIG